jgi:uncharacterized protein YyaL (SSP411 family)
MLEVFAGRHDAGWLVGAVRLAADPDARFRDDDGTFITTADVGELLIARPRELLDNAVPSSSSVMADVHLRLAALTGDQAHADAAEATIATIAASAARMPLAFGELLCAIERHLAPSTEVAVVGAPSPARDALVAAYRERWRPGAVLAVGSPEPAPDAPAVGLLRDRPLRDAKPTAYVCHHFVCELPVTSPDELRAQLDGDGADAPTA